MGVNHEIKAVIWDMGGVILRSEHYRYREELAARFKISEIELEHRVFNTESAELASIGKMSQNEHWRITGLSLGLTEEEIPAFEKAFWAGDRCDQQLVSFIRSLKKDFKTGLLSNAWMGTREMLRDKYACLDAFDVAVFSYEVGMAKPDPRIYHLILGMVKAEPANTIFVDDFIENVTAANALGIHAVQFKNREQAIQDIQQIINN